MEKRLRDYIRKIEELLLKNPREEARKELREEMLIQIGFFQHERLIHLIVTALFAILTIIMMLGCLVLQLITLYCLAGLFFILLVPYIRHYFILENGVQKLYLLYDQLISYI